MTELQQAIAIASGQASAEQIEAHRVAGDLPIVMYARNKPSLQDLVNDAELYLWLKQHFLCADFTYLETSDATIKATS